ncbi:MAG: response regulator transcription factor [Cyclobacteriaceae bacterium]|nr:response regulator transcription factor [Cyclobacteriaceae bacterium]
MSRIKVLLADDHTIVLEGLRQVLSLHESLEVVGEAQNGEEVLQFIENQAVDIVILDINMPVMDGITCARILKKDFPQIKIIILTMYAQKSFIEEIVKIGIDGCLLKSNTGKELKEAIDRVMGGKNYYDLIKTFRTDTEEIAQYKLSPREIEIIKLIAEGLKSADIADKLFISKHTVHTHRKNIMRKTGSDNTSQLIQFARTNNLI